ncbi:MAG: hypothetical protein V4523_14345 [Pseudomonadota bacterium]
MEWVPVIAIGMLMFAAYGIWGMLKKGSQRKMLEDRLRSEAGPNSHIIVTEQVDILSKTHGLAVSEDDLWIAEGDDIRRIPHSRIVKAEVSSKFGAVESFVRLHLTIDDLAKPSFKISMIDAHAPTQKMARARADEWKSRLDACIHRSRINPPS